MKRPQAKFLSFQHEIARGTRVRLALTKATIKVRRDEMRKYEKVEWYRRRKYPLRLCLEKVEHYDMKGKCNAGKYSQGKQEEKNDRALLPEKAAFSLRAWNAYRYVPTIGK